MLFNSYAFLLFFPVVLAVYWALRRCLQVQNVCLVVASYVFYAWWDVRFLGLILFVTLVGYVAGLLSEAAGCRRLLSRLCCLGAVVVGLGVLALFKYYDFFVLSAIRLLSLFGLSVSWPLLRWVLPVGISFYTFQMVGYVVDVHRRQLPACRDVLAFAAFLSFFPQLVAGPIERAARLLPQMTQPRSLSAEAVTGGLRLMLWGLVKKMLVADRCAPLVDAVYANPAADGLDLWVATVLFAFQIYCDFSGYSDIAVGAARLFGISLMRNFDMPYLATNVADFWRRWHISLMTWLRDYVYIPLGGSHRGPWRRLVNTLVVFLASGLWHGANFTFVAWGAYHALCFVPLVWFRSRAPRPRRFLPASLPLSGLSLWLKRGLTFAVVCVGWVFFRSQSLGEAFSRLAAMTSSLSLHSPYGGWSSLALPLALMAVEALTPSRECPLAFRGRGLWAFRPVRWAVYYALVFAVLYWGGAQAEFIYFQF